MPIPSLEEDVIKEKLTKLKQHQTRLNKKITEHPEHSTIRYILFFDFDGTLTKNGHGFKLKNLKNDFTKFIGGDINEKYFRYFLRSIHQNVDDFKMIILTWNNFEPVQTFLQYAFTDDINEREDIDVHEIISKEHSRYRYSIKNKVDQIKDIYKNTDFMKHNDKLFFFEDRKDNLECMTELVYINCVLVEPECNFVDRLVRVCFQYNFKPEDLLDTDKLKIVLDTIYRNFNECNKK